MTKTAVLILAAGQGKRLRSSTSKVLHGLAGQPVIDYTIALARSLKPDQIVVVVPPADNPITAHLKTTHPDITLAVQDTPKGTGHAVMAAKRYFRAFTGDVLILCGDVPLLTRDTCRAFYHNHRKADAALSIMTCQMTPPTGYGRILRDASGEFVDIIEERDATRQQKTIHEINGGIYWANASLLFKTLTKLTPDNDQNEYYLTDVPRILSYKHRVHTWQIADATELHGINTRQDLALAHRLLYDRTRTHWMTQGVTLIDPATTYIDPTAILSADCILEPNCHLRGRTKVGRHTRIGVGSVIEDSTIAESVSILPYCVIEDSRLDDHTQVGPFAHLRPHSHLKPHAKVGNFVEMKKTILGEGAKANHLTYLGDTVVGKKANIGAGTITCNYDGVNKWKTIIGAGAFIGSNTALVAPVSIGESSVVGAGSTITKDVPPDALVLTRSFKKTIDNWTAKSRKGNS